MPTVLVIGPYRFYFYSHESNEPPHVHVDREGCTAKFWLEKVTLACHQKKFLEKWYGYFGS